MADQHPEIESKDEIMNLLTDAQIELMLWNEPGMSDVEMMESMSPTQKRAFDQSLQRMIATGRITAVRFTSNPPHFRTCFRYFATAKGRVEIVAQNGMSYAYVHDPLGTWNEAMNEARDE